MEKRQAIPVMFLLTFFSLQNHSQILVSAYVSEECLIDYSTASSYLALDLTRTKVSNSSYLFLGTTYSNIFAGKDGIIVFGKYAETPYVALRCEPIPTSSHPAMAVFVQYLDKGRIFYEELYLSEAPTSFQTIREDISLAFPNFVGTLFKMLMVTWTPVTGENYPYMNSTFQGILATDNKNTFALFYYNQIDYKHCFQESKYTKAGIFSDSGWPNVNFIVPGSCHSLCYLAGRSNVGRPGKFVFKVDKTVEQPEKPVHNPQLISVQPRVVPMIGSVTLIAYGIEIFPQMKIKEVVWQFKNEGNITTDPIAETLFIEGRTPLSFTYLGKIKLNVVLKFSDESELVFESHVFVQNNMLPKVPAISVGLYGLLTVFWSPENLRNGDLNTLYSSHLGRDIEITKFANVEILHLDSFGEWLLIYQHSTLNNGKSSIKITTSERTTLEQYKGPKVIKICSNRGFQITHRWSWELSADVLDTTVALNSWQPQSYHDEQCRKYENMSFVTHNDTLPCPTSLTHAFYDWRFTYNGPEKEIYKFTQNTPSDSNSGSLCSYNPCGKLLLETKHGSYIQKYSPYNRNFLSNHYQQDSMPYMWCCVFENSSRSTCNDNFMRKRAVPTNYKYPDPYLVAGVNQIVTLDGARYRLNSEGAFFLFNSSAISAQILAEEYLNMTGVTVTTGVAIALNGDSKITFKVLAVTEGLQIFMDNEPANFYHTNAPGIHQYTKDNFTIYGNTYTVFINGTSSVLISISTGVTMKITPNENSTSINIIGSFSHTLMTMVQGLLGNYDGKMENDLYASNCTHQQRKDCMSEFFEKWKVSPEELQFQLPDEYSRRSNRGTVSMVTTNDDTVWDKIENCLKVQECALDYNLTLNAEFSLSALDTHTEFEQMLALTSRAEEVDIQHNPTLGKENTPTNETDLSDEADVNRNMTDYFPKQLLPIAYLFMIVAVGIIAVMLAQGCSRKQPATAAVGNSIIRYSRTLDAIEN